VTDDELQTNAVRLIERAIAGALEDRRVIHCEAEATWYPGLLRNLSEHEIHVLERGGDMVVFFDPAGQAIGWRDDGRRGAPVAIPPDVETARGKVVEELGLPKDTRAGRMEVRELPPVGMTFEMVLFLKPAAEPEDVVRVWLSPQDLRVIQCLYGRAAMAGGGQ
jgi:hypothetical protein